MMLAVVGRGTRHAGVTRRQRVRSTSSPDSCSSSRQHSVIIIIIIANLMLDRQLERLACPVLVPSTTPPPSR